MLAMPSNFIRSSPCSEEIERMFVLPHLSSHIVLPSQFIGNTGFCARGAADKSNVMNIALAIPLSETLLREIRGISPCSTPQTLFSFTIFFQFLSVSFHFLFIFFSFSFSFIFFLSFSFSFCRVLNQFLGPSRGCLFSFFFLLFFSPVFFSCFSSCLSVGYHLDISEDQVESRVWWAAGGSSPTFVPESPGKCPR